ncbi:Na+/H+ antiporter NhaA [Minwuia sp.]|uniref:Na+/H+ antiporter NhaA n=1 Tax=Minwuia sp. TaxID=2493630 RepID=UPI003A8DCF6A
MVARTLERFINHEASSGIFLLIAAALALMLDNSPLAWLYDSLLTTPLAVQVGSFAIDKPLLLWINDGLMAVFFFLVGLEIKREVMRGELSSRDRIALPGVAALGGMVVPALIYILLTRNNPELLNGWAIPAATDIAFALGILALLGSRVPIALKIFLLALAIIDDLGAIVIIALFYTADLSTSMLLGGGLALAGLVILNLIGVKKTAPYILIGIIMWVFVLKSGVHATLAGVALALTIPMGDDRDHSPLEHLEHGLQPWVAFMVMPIFAFANAGVSLAGLNIDMLLQPLTLGIALGLCIGKPVGIFAFVWVAVKARITRLPDGVTWAQIFGVSALAGIGFTMSLFIGTLAFEEDPAAAAGVRLGVLGGSFISAIVGLAILWRAIPGKLVPPPSPVNSST